MAQRVTLERNSFAAGELDPLMAVRSDTAFWQSGAERLLNWRLRATGGAQTRPGLRLVRELTFASGLAPIVPRLIPFVFREDQTYLLAFADGWLEIYDADGEQLQVLTGMPWTLARLDQLTWAQLGDTMIVCQHTMRPQIIRRVSATEFTVGALVFESNEAATRRFQPYHAYEPPSVSLTPSATSGAITLTTSADVFVDGHDNAIVRYRGREILITEVVGPREAQGTVRETLPGTGATTDWDEQAFSQARQYPAAVAFYENRLWLGGGYRCPSHFWASRSNAWFNFELGTDDDDAIAERISHPTKMPRIRYFVGGRQLVIGTDCGGYYVPSSETKPVTPSSIAPRLQTSFGWARVQPRTFDGGLLYVQLGGRAIRDFVWSDQAQQYVSPSVSLLASHIVVEPVDLDIVDDSTWGPEQYAFAVLADGTLAVLHSIRDEQVLAWTPWRTDGRIRRVCCVEGQVFVVVERRRFDDITVATLERFEPGLLVDEAVTREADDDASGAGVWTFDGLAAHRGLTLQAIAGGTPIGAVTIPEDGVVTIVDPPMPAPTLTVGRRIDTLLRTLPPDLRDRNGGSIRGRRVSVARAIVTVDRAQGFVVNGEAAPMAFTGDSGERPPLTGDIEFRPLGWDGGQITIETPLPADVTVLGVTVDVAVGG